MISPVCGYLELLSVPAFEVDNYLLLHVVYIVLRVDDLVFDLAELLICIAVAALKVLHFPQQRQLLLVNHDLVSPVAIVIETIVLPARVGRSLLLLLLDQSLLDAVHFLFGRVDLDRQSLHRVLFALDLFAVLQNGPFQILAVVTLSLIFYEGGLFIYRSALFLTSFFFFAGGSVRGGGVLLLLSIF